MSGCDGSIQLRLLGEAIGVIEREQGIKTE